MSFAAIRAARSLTRAVRRVAPAAPRRAPLASASAPASAAAAALFRAPARTNFTITPLNVEGKDGPLFEAERPVRSVAVVAHVDHGKTALVDRLIKATKGESDGSMDRNPLEKERGITILSKVTSILHNETTVNIIDTPGHADFAGEVERVLHLVDSVLLVTCAVEGPMPQTRYVLSKALARGLPAVVVVNKADRDGARLGAVENEIFDLFVALEATDAQLDFPLLYASARHGWATESLEEARKAATAIAASNAASAAATADGSSAAAAAAAGAAAAGAEGSALLASLTMAPLLDRLLLAPKPRVLGGADAPFRMLVSQMDVAPFVGKTVIGRVSAGTVRIGDPVAALARDGAKTEEAKVTKLFARRGTAQLAVESAIAGDIIELAGLTSPIPTSSIVAPSVTRPIYADPIDPPTIAMAFSVNDSPLGGREGSFLTSSMIAARLEKEAQSNVALEIIIGGGNAGGGGGAGNSVDLSGGTGLARDAIEVRGRGELQLAILIETMRREGFELCVSPPTVLIRTEADPERPNAKIRLEP
jgi:GTP-binding protein